MRYNEWHKIKNLSDWFNFNIRDEIKFDDILFKKVKSNDYYDYVKKISFIYIQTNFFANKIIEQVFSCYSSIQALKLELINLREKNIDDNYIAYAFYLNNKKYNFYNDELFDEKIIRFEIHGSDIRLYIHLEAYLNYIIKKGYIQYTKLSELCAVVNFKKEFDKGLKLASNYAIETELIKIIKENYIDKILLTLKNTNYNLPIKLIKNLFEENLIIEFDIAKSLLKIKINTLLLVKNLFCVEIFYNYLISVKKDNYNNINDEVYKNYKDYFNKKTNNYLLYFSAIEGLYIILDKTTKKFLTIKN